MTSLKRATPVASNNDVNKIRDLLVETLKVEGVDPTVDDAGNIVASRGTAEPMTRLILSTYIDTVSPHVPYDRDEGVTHGRGPRDVKGSFAVLLPTFSAADPGPDVRVTLAIMPDEEFLSMGVVQLDLDGDRYIVGEPTGLDAYTIAKSRFKGTVSLLGIVTHTAEPQLGVNVVGALVPVLDALRSFDGDHETYPDLGPVTLTPTTVGDGASSNQMPTDYRPVVDHRSVPPETAESSREEFESTFRAIVPDDVGVGFVPMERPTPFPEAFATDPDHESVTPFAAAPRDVGGRTDARPFMTAIKASYFSPAPVAVFGPGDPANDEDAVMHVDREYVRTDDVRTAAAAFHAAVATLAA